MHEAYVEAISLNARLETITNDVLSTQVLGQKPKISDQPPPAVLKALKDLCSPILPTAVKERPKT